MDDSVNAGGTTRMGEACRVRVHVDGIVQGVGFRPFVHALAARLGLAGHVVNTGVGVIAEAEGPGEAVAAFVRALREEAPPLAVVEDVRVEWLDPVGGTGFTIAASEGGGERQALVSPDTGTCEDCLAELWDPADRRYRYPFINCTNCGPRFTIVLDVPYDRPSTTMRSFEMCEACAREYEDPTDRRFHAQPVCCPVCGPTLRLEGGEQGAEDAAVTGAARLLAEGAVLAVKGLGGYHLAVDATDEEAVATLRARKHREERPFALMVAGLAAARRLCAVDDAEARVLTSPRRPIVLLAKRADATLAEGVAPGNRHLGLMLPYTPLHHLLADAHPRPFVLTSGNLSDEPIAYRDDDARERLAGIADAFLTHDRPIHVRTDDSVTRVWRGAELPVRRSRGWVPHPVPVRWGFPRHVLACGAELKNTFCVAKARHAFVSHHIGDLENLETLQSFTAGIEHFRRLFDIDPEVVAHDLHPEYLSTKYAVELADVELVGVQHHHAHVASCLADNGHEGPVIGVAYDGLGFGTDGTVWGGELLVADLADFKRAGHLETVPLPGGEAAIRNPWRMAAAWLDRAYEGAPPDDLDVVRRNAERWRHVLAVARAGVNTPPTSSAGRLFDAVSAILGVRDAVSYEGQAAIELEQLAGRQPVRPYDVGLGDGEVLELPGAAVIRAVVDDLRAGTDVPTIAARFHATVTALTVAACETLRERTGLGVVALSGGVFQNLLLLDRTVDGLEAAGFEALTHSRVPPNDGGISLGQAAVAAARDRRAPESGNPPRSA